MTMTKTALTTALHLVLAAAVTACAGVPSVPEPEIQAYLADKPPSLRGLYRKALVDGPREWVRNHMLASTAAMESGQFSTAEESLDQALLGIETVYANSESAAKARRLWREEGSKDFKGEPYERAMAYFYRGLLYFQEHDYENARASFRSGMFQDVAGENSEYEEDFALMSTLEGFASQCNGDALEARDAFERVKTLRADFTAPAPGDNVLVVAETGNAPQKLRDGPKGAWLRFAPGDPTPEAKVRVRAAGSAIEAFPVEDLFFQASTRGGRPIEAVLEGHAQFKEDMETTGAVAMGVGTTMSLIGAVNNNTDLQGIGAGIALAGLLIDVASTAITPGADTRAWTSLPGQEHVASLHAGQPDMPIEIDVLDAQGLPIESRSVVGTVAGGGACQVVWLRPGSSTGTDEAPALMGMVASAH